jgi:hypothetical protein
MASKDLLATTEPGYGGGKKPALTHFDHLGQQRTLRDTTRRISVPPLFFYHYGAFETLRLQPARTPFLPRPNVGRQGFFFMC